MAPAICKSLYYIEGAGSHKLLHCLFIFVAGEAAPNVIGAGSHLYIGFKRHVGWTNIEMTPNMLFPCKLNDYAFELSHIAYSSVGHQMYSSEMQKN